MVAREGVASRCLVEWALQWTVPTSSWPRMLGEFIAVRSLGVVCWAGLIYRKPCSVVLLPKLFGIVGLVIQGQEEESPVREAPLPFWELGPSRPAFKICCGGGFHGRGP